MALPDIPDPPVPLPDAVPWDTAISALAGWWMGCQCSDGCHHMKLMPLRLMASERGWHLTLRQIVPRVLCGRCRKPPARLWLTDDPAGSHGRAGIISRELDLLA